MVPATYKTTLQTHNMTHAKTSNIDSFSSLLHTSDSPKSSLCFRCSFSFHSMLWRSVTFTSTRSVDYQFCTLLPPTCIPGNLFRVMTLLTNSPYHPLIDPQYLMLFELIIREDSWRSSSWFGVHGVSFKFLEHIIDIWLVYIPYCICRCACKNGVSTKIFLFRCTIFTPKLWVPIIPQH